MNIGFLAQYHSLRALVYSPVKATLSHCVQEATKLSRLRICIAQSFLINLKLSFFMYEVPESSVLSLGISSLIQIRIAIEFVVFALVSLSLKTHALQGPLRISFVNCGGISGITSPDVMSKCLN